MPRAIIAFAAATAAAAACVITAHAYSAFGKWAVMPVIMYVNPNNLDVSAAAAEAALQEAMNVWNTQGSSALRFDYGGRVNDTSVGNDGKSVIVFRNAADGGALASTYAWAGSNGSLVDADIVFWDGAYTFFSGTSGCSGGVYIEDVAAHELGHVAGLSHSDYADATMYPVIGWCSQEWRTLSPDDIAGIRSIYPEQGSSQSPATPSGLSVGSAGTSSLGVSWRDNATNETGFRLERSLNGSSFTLVTLIGANVTSYADSGLASGTTYYYRVSAYNASGSSTFSNVGSGTTSSGTNAAPTVSIANPVNGASYPEGAAVTFSGSASDVQDGNLSAILAWTSSLDGNLGSGPTFSRTLSAGSHVITARVTDSGGLTSSRQANVTVTSAGVSGPSLVVRGYKTKNIKRVDLVWNGATAASVDVYRNGVRILTTVNDGLHVDTIATKRGGSFTYRVCDSGTSTCSNEATVVF